MILSHARRFVFIKTPKSASTSVEAALSAAESGDYAAFRELLQILQRPYEDQPEVAEYEQPPQPSQRVTQTFCGT